MEWPAESGYEKIRRTTDKTDAVIDCEALRLNVRDCVSGETIHDSSRYTSLEDAKRAAEIIDAAYIPGRRLVTHWCDGKLIGADAVDPELTPA
jgi:hypothetical protein